VKQVAGAGLVAAGIRHPEKADGNSTDKLVSQIPTPITPQNLAKPSYSNQYIFDVIGMIV
jgi:hypothetical protein